MKTRKIFIIIAIVFTLILSICSNAYATVTTLTIDDSSDNTGYTEVDGQLYYVVAINLETVGGNISGVKFKIQYDSEYLQPLESDKTVDLGSKGKFTGAGKLGYSEWSNDERERFNQDTMIFNAYHNDSNNQLTGIVESKINLINICFKVLENDSNEKGAVFIDLKNQNTELLHSNVSTQDRYITNGIASSEIDKLLGIGAQNEKEEITVKYTDGSETKVDVDKKDEKEDEEKNTIKEEAKQIQELEKNNEVPSNDGTKKSAKDSDKTLAKTILPNTGVATVLGIIVVIGGISAVLYKKMKKI